MRRRDVWKGVAAALAAVRAAFAGKHEGGMGPREVREFYGSIFERISEPEFAARFKVPGGFWADYMERGMFGRVGMTIERDGVSYWSEPEDVMRRRHEHFEQFYAAMDDEERRRRRGEEPREVRYSRFAP